MAWYRQRALTGSFLAVGLVFACSGADYTFAPDRGGGQNNRANDDSGIGVNPSSGGSSGLGGSSNGGSTGSSSGLPVSGSSSGSSSSTSGGADDSGSDAEGGAGSGGGRDGGSSGGPCGACTTDSQCQTTCGPPTQFRANWCCTRGFCASVNYACGASSSGGDSGPPCGGQNQPCCAGMMCPTSMFMLCLNSTCI
jgi:hypothetical protein